MFRRITVGLALALGLAFLTPAPASAVDTEGCVSRGEYDNLETFLSVAQVTNRFDTNGWFIGISVNDEFIKRGYNPCWDDGDRKVVVWFDITLGLTDHWDVRDA